MPKDNPLVERRVDRGLEAAQHLFPAPEEIMLSLFMELCLRCLKPGHMRALRKMTSHGVKLQRNVCS